MVMRTGWYFSTTAMLYSLAAIARPRSTSRRFPICVVLLARPRDMVAGPGRQAATQRGPRRGALTVARQRILKLHHALQVDLHLALLVPVQRRNSVAADGGLEQALALTQVFEEADADIDMLV